MIRILLTIVIFLLAVSAYSQMPRPLSVSEADELIRIAIVGVRRTNFVMVSDHTYKFRRTIVNKNGKTELKTYESFFPSRLKRKGGNRAVIVQLEENGKPLDPKRIERERQDAAKKLDNLATDNDNTWLERVRERGLDLDWSYDVAVNVSTFLEVCKTSYVGTETANGRETAKFAFDQCDPGKLNETKKYLAKARGLVWIDLVDKIPVRLEASAKGGSTELPAVRVTHQRVGEKYWFLQTIEVNGLKNKDLFPDLKLDWKMEFFDFRAAETEVKDVRIDP